MAKSKKDSGNLREGITGLTGRSSQVFAYFSPNGLAHSVAQNSKYYLPRLRFMRNLIIQQLSEGGADTATFETVLEELRNDEHISLVLPEEVFMAVSLRQLATVLLGQYGSADEACKEVIAKFEKLINDLECGQIHCYDEEDFRIRPLIGLQEQRSGYEYDVALSFAGEDRHFVEEVAQYLKANGIKVFYDLYEEVNLWGKNLYEHLRSVYRDRARFTVIFISAAYASKVWTSHEWQSVQERALSESREYILPARFDSTPLPGLLKTIAYVDLSTITPESFAATIVKKLKAARKHQE